MTIGQVYAKTINNYQVETKAIQILMAHVLKYQDTNELFLHMHEPMQHLADFEMLILKHLDGMPIQYLLNKAYFLDLELYVDEAVLIPRPETEQLIDELIASMKHRQIKVIADLGTGSGCLAIAIKKRYPHMIVYASDISQTALEVAKKNAKFHGTDIIFLEGNWLEPFERRQINVDAIIANPPYIASSKTVASNVLQHEPHSALFALDGISNHQHILSMASRIINPHGVIILEIDEEQDQQVKAIASSYFKDAKIKISRDLQGKNRFITVEL